MKWLKSIIFLLLSLNGFSQPNGEIGLIGGGAYYLGEYNPNKHFEGVQSYYGGFYRYNLNDRFALRLNFGISRTDVTNNHFLDENGVAYPARFKSSLRDVMGVVEVNFRSFMVPKVDKSSLWAPYLFTGVGFAGSDEDGGVAIPLGLGVKFNLYRQVSVGIEWSARKLFTDKLDGISDQWGIEESNLFFSKDWVFVAGLTVSYRFPYSPECRGYK